MVSLKRKQHGFTIVELLIVIVVIGILALLVITTFTGIQQKARDTERTTDIKAVYSQIEAYYQSAGHYPSRANMNDSTFRGDNMKGLDPEALKDPHGDDQTLCTTATAKCYGYAPTNDAGTSCESDATTCTKYTLKADYEAGTNQSITKTNLN